MKQRKKSVDIEFYIYSEMLGGHYCKTIKCKMQKLFKKRTLIVSKTEHVRNNFNTSIFRNRIHFTFCILTYCNNAVRSNLITKNKCLFICSDFVRLIPGNKYPRIDWITIYYIQ